MTTFTDAQLVDIARSQKSILRLILSSILLLATGSFMPATITNQGILLAAIVVVGVIGILLIYRLANALEESPWVYVVCAMIPCVNTATLVIMSLKATGVLKRRGIQVGLMGVDAQDLKILATAARDHRAKDGSQSDSAPYGPR
jgi:hypothetical protein